MLTSARLTSARRAAAVLAAAAALPAGLLLAGGAAGAPPPRPAHSAQYQVRVIVNGARLRHAFIPAGKKTARAEALSSPDAITVLGHDIYASFQNGVGPQGQPSADGNTDSTIVEFTAGGRIVRQWDLRGKCDGITADTARHLLYATVNEDAHSSIYSITPGARPGRRVVHYRYNVPLRHDGGTDAVSIWGGTVLISASAPGTTGKAAPQPSYPAVYTAAFDARTRVATVRPLFTDEATATVANLGKGFGKKARLALTDPDSSEVVPASGPRFGGDFMLTSQGDKEQIFYRRGGLRVLRLANSVDDTAWARSARGMLVGANTGGDTVDVVTGPFRPESIFVAVTPCDASDAPATCPGPGFPPNYLGQLNPWTGAISKVDVRGPAFGPQGLIFIGPGWNAAAR
jgi:hypothetical protein